MFGKLFDQNKEDGQQGPSQSGQQSPFDKQANPPQQVQAQPPVQSAVSIQPGTPQQSQANTQQTSADQQAPVQSSGAAAPNQTQGDASSVPTAQGSAVPAVDNSTARADMAALTHLDPRTAQVLTRAQEEAKRIYQQYIEPDQLLLGLLYDEQIYKELEGLSVDSGTFSKEIQTKETMGTFKGQPMLSKTTEEVFDQAYRDSKMRGENFIAPEDLLIVLFNPQYTTSKLLESHNLKKEVLVEKFSKDPNVNFGHKSVLEKYGTDLTLEAREGKLDPVAGRDKEIDRIVHILLRRTKNNPIIIGETGVGKTAIVEGLAQKVVSGQIPHDLQDKRIFQLDVASLVAGASHRGEFEERLRGVINEVLGSSNKIILFIDEIHALMGTGEGEGMNAANIIKPHLARGHFQLIGATTTTEYRKNFEKDKAFERRFQPVIADEPSEENAVEMLKVLRPKYEKFHHVTIPDDALKQCVSLAKKYIGERYLPDKGVDLLDEACSEVKLQMDSGQRSDGQVRKADIEKVVSAWTGIPITRLTEDESEKLLKLEDRIHKRLIDQEEAVVSVSEAVRRGRIGLASGVRPIASFVFLGPTGVGKTELAKTLAELLFGRDDSMARLDMSEYMEKHEVAKLIGAPPGYVGYEEGGVLTEAVRKKPYSIVLMDEIEKAHPDVFNILLQLLDDGRLTDNKGNTISFKNTIIICTSNIGSSLIQQQLANQDPKVKKTPEEFQKVYKDLNKVIKEELIKFFRPELLNRFDEVVVFKPLQPEHMAGIARLGIAKTAALLKEQGFNLQITELAIAQLAKDGYDPIYGARPLRRLIQTAVENPIALAIISKKFSPGDTIVIDYNSNINEFVSIKGGQDQIVTAIDDQQFWVILQNIAHPETVVNENDKPIYAQFHDVVVKASSQGNKNAVFMLTVSGTTPIADIRTLRNNLQDAKINGDDFAKSVMDMISGQASQLQATSIVKKAFLELVNPSIITSTQKRDIFAALHAKLAAASTNPLAARILSIGDATTTTAVDELMAELKNASQSGDGLANDVISTINSEIADQAEKAHAKDPVFKFRKAIKQIINPLYLASPVNRDRFEKIYEELAKAYQTNNQLAIAILSVTDITADADLILLRQQLESASQQGDTLAATVLTAINEAIAGDATMEMKNTLLLIVNPLTAATAQDREKFTAIKEKIYQASQHGNDLAVTILSLNNTVTDDMLQKLADRLQVEKDKHNEVAGLILDSLTSELPKLPAVQPPSVSMPSVQPVQQMASSNPSFATQTTQQPVMMQTEQIAQDQPHQTAVPQMVTQEVAAPNPAFAGLGLQSPQAPIASTFQNTTTQSPMPPQEVVPVPGITNDPVLTSPQPMTTNPFTAAPATFPGNTASNGASMQPDKQS